MRRGVVIGKLPFTVLAKVSLKTLVLSIFDDIFRVTEFAFEYMSLSVWTMSKKAAYSAIYCHFYFTISLRYYILCLV
jgi:hypothetical protein